MYAEVIKELGITQDEDFTMLVLMYELGMVAKNIIYSKRFGSAGYLGDKKAEIGDLHAMSHLLAELNHMDITEMEKVGFERFVHRMHEVKKKMLTDKALNRD